MRLESFSGERISKAPTDDCPLSGLDETEEQPAVSAGQTFSMRKNCIALGILLLLGLGLRLYAFNAPPVDFLSWRDTQTLMVARNFFRHNMNLFQPAIDWRTTDEVLAHGTVGGTELQITPWLTALLYYIFGIRYWVGRVVPLFFALLGATFFYRLCRRWFGLQCAFIATFLLTLSPYYLYTGRLQMPESFTFAMVFAALYYYERWTSERSRRDFFCAAFFSAAMLLGKPQVGVTVLPMAVMTFRRMGWRTFWTPAVYGFAVLVSLPVGAFMYYSYGVLLPRTGLSFAQPAILELDQWLLNPSYYRDVGLSLWKWALTPGVVVFALIGLWPFGRSQHRCWPYAWLLGSLLFFFIIPGGVRDNGYYQLVLVPPVVLLAARSLSALLTRRSWWRYGVVGLVMLGIALNCLSVALDLWAPRYTDAMHCGEWLKANTPPETLVLSSNPSPTMLYFADRTGWTTWAEHYGKGAGFNLEILKKTRKLGAQIVAVPDAWFDNAFQSARYDSMRDVLYDSFRCYKGADFTVFFLGARADLHLPPTNRVAFGRQETRIYLRGTWGPNQGKQDTGTFVAMGPAKRAALRFAAPQGAHTLVLAMSSAVPEQDVSVEIQGGGTVQHHFEKAFQLAEIHVPLPQASANGHPVVFLEATKKNSDGASLLLYALKTDN